MNTITRTESVDVLSGFCEQEEYWELEIPAPYRHKRITVNVHFHPDRPCTGTDCEALKINDAGIVELNISHLPARAGSGPGVQLRMKNPRAGERYRVTWKHPSIIVPKQVAT